MTANEIKWIVHPNIYVIIHDNDVDDNGNNDEAFMSTSEHTLLYKCQFFPESFIT